MSFDFFKLKTYLDARGYFFTFPEKVNLVNKPLFSNIKNKFKWVDLHFIFYIPLLGNSVGFFYGALPDYCFVNTLKKLVKQKPYFVFHIRICVISIPRFFNFKNTFFIQIPFLKHLYNECFLEFYNKYFSFLDPIESFVNKYLLNDLPFWDFHFRYFMQDYFNNGWSLQYPYYAWSDFSFSERNYFLALFLYSALFSTWVYYYNYNHIIIRKPKRKSKSKAKYKSKGTFKRKTLISTFISYRNFVYRLLYRRIVRATRRVFK